MLPDYGKTAVMKRNDEIIDDDIAWAAVLTRDRSADGKFVTGVLSTGIYCRPSCAARHPKRGNVRFFADGAAARAAGLRPCLRCLPDDVGRDSIAIAEAVRLIDAAETPPTLATLSAAVGYSATHFQRVFKRALGVSPADYARGKRGERLLDALGAAPSVTNAIYDAGYSGPTRFYADAEARLGMVPTRWRDGGKGETIRWAVTRTSLGSILVAVTRRGICRLSFDENGEDLATHFPNADIAPGDAAMRDLVARAAAAVEAPAAYHGLAIDVRGTAFQTAIWRELTRIAPGETLSYAALAARAGKAGAVRAAGSACGANPVAVLVPCHRVTRSDGSPGGYAYGAERKAELLRREGRK